MNHSNEFIRFTLDHQILQFGEFQLKSGRQSPYFFNAGLFNTGALIQALGHYYAKAIIASKIEFDMLFGPAYKGIPLVTSVAIALAAHQRDVPFCFNRKEAKAHGEGGHLVGAPLHGRVLIIDDVVTAGTAFREAKDLIEAAGARVAAIAIALDRQERGTGDLSAVDEITTTHHIPIIPIANLDNIIEYLQTMPDKKNHLEMIIQYQKNYRSKK